MRKMVTIMMRQIIPILNRKSIPVERVIKRSDYDSDNVNNDIALLRLAQVLVFITLATITRLSYFKLKIYKKNLLS